MIDVIKKIPFYFRVILDKDTPKRAKWMLVLIFVYLISPIDIIPDFDLIIGQLDDLVVIPFLFYLATSMVPKEIIERHRRHSS